MKKALNTIVNIFVWLVVLFAVGMMIFTVVSVRTFDQNNRSILGHKAYIVRSDSMSATDFSAGDLILVKEVDPSTLQAGDVIAFTSQDSSNFGETVTHKIRKTTTVNGEPAFVTYGTTTGVDDATAVTYPYILGKYVKVFPKVGTFFSFLKTTQGYIICILIPFLLLIGYQGLNCVQLFRAYKKEQMAELQAEKDQIQKEKEETAAMMKELLELKAQLAQQNAETAEETKQV